MDFSIDTSKINMEAPIQDKSLPIKDIANFPSKQAEAIQKHLLELDKQGKLLDYFKEQYTNLGAENSLANYILKNWETDGKKFYLEWTGIEVFKENKTFIKAAGVKLNEIAKGSNKHFLWKCGTCGNEWAAHLNIIKSQQAIIACYFFAYRLSKLVFMWVCQNFQVEWKR